MNCTHCKEGKLEKYSINGQPAGQGCFKCKNCNLKVYLLIIEEPKK